MRREVAGDLWGRRGGGGDCFIEEKRCALIGGRAVAADCWRGDARTVGSFWLGRLRCVRADRWHGESVGGRRRREIGFGARVCDLVSGPTDHRLFSLGGSLI